MCTSLPPPADLCWKGPSTASWPRGCQWSAKAPVLCHWVSLHTQAVMRATGRVVLDTDCDSPWPWGVGEFIVAQSFWPPTPHPTPVPLPASSPGRLVAGGPCAWQPAGGLSLVPPGTDGGDEMGLLPCFPGDETYQDIFRDFSQMASHHPEKLKRFQPPDAQKP
ncbi:hypothetical protein JRQ81_017570 [Phrynocephalus forsythii]|uniref:Uncharacterized protein n=1 Tax=Phrynocephalus forsythii TaxID=171643 RepID=A0A9Q1B0M1_9SAUR|nr:hypothetical protein JRQ81_017570 [Phrynocephalus forsythii]